MAAPTAMPKKGMKKSRPNKLLHKAPPSAPAPVRSPKSLVLGFFLPSGQVTVGVDHAASLQADQAADYTA